MNRRLESVFSTFLADAGALAPAQLGTASAATPDAARLDRFIAALESCRASTRSTSKLLFAAYLALLLGVFALLYCCQRTGSSASIVALLGSSGAAGLIVIPVRMQSLWKDLTLMEMTLAILPGQPPKEQLALIKTLHAANRAAGASRSR